jgi:hypothetical protein
MAPIDLTGYWVSYVTENWRYRMVTPAKGEYRRIPVSPAAVPIINAWDPSADTRAGNQCKSYGAGAIMPACRDLEHARRLPAQERCPL